MPSRWRLLVASTVVMLTLTPGVLLAVRLNTLTLSAGQLSPAFNSGVFNYTASVASTVSSIRVTVTAPSGSTIRVNGVVTASGQPSASLPLATGPNTITIAATWFWWTDTYRVVVTRQGTSSNTPPTVDITAPASGAVLNQGVAMTFAGTASDAQDGAISSRISWSSSPAGLSGTGAQVTAMLAPGTYTVTAAVADLNGATATDTVSIRVNAAPTVSIISPPAGSSVADGTMITFEAAAADAEDGPLSDRITWSSTPAGLSGTGASISTTLPVGTYAITVSVADDEGLARSASISVNVFVPGASRPNVLLIVADDMGAEASSLYPAITGTSIPASMPAIEALAARGVVFNNAWASPLCSPTRATLLSGQYGNRTGVTTVGNRLPTTVDSLFKYIARESPASYGMGVFGKWHLSGTNGNGTSADASHVRETGVPAFWGFFGGGISNYFSWTAYNQNGTATTGTRYATSATTDQASAFIRQHRAARPNDPWFVYLPYNAPHSPYHAPPASLLPPGTPTGDNRARYKAMMQAMDAEIDRLFDEIDLDLTNTVVIFMGDNGTPSDVKPSGTLVRGSKISVYEGGVRVPLVIAGAGVTRIGREDAPVVSTDLYTTIAAIAGIPVSQRFDSFSLVPLLSATGATSGRTHAFSETCSSTFGRRYAIRDGRYKLLSDNGVWGMYDLLNDPLESTNLYSNGGYASIRTGLQNALNTIKAGSAAGCFQ